MSKAALNGDVFCFLDKKQLVNLKTKAMRSGAWFKALQRIDRVLFDLTIRVVDTIRSAKLAKSTRAHKEAGRCYEKQFFESFEGDWFASGSKNQFHGSEVRKYFCWWLGI